MLLGKSHFPTGTDRDSQLPAKRQAPTTRSAAGRLGPKEDARGSDRSEDRQAALDFQPQAE